MSDRIIEATDQDFQEQTKSGTVIVDFWATWCGPCRMQSEILHGLADKLPENVKIVKVNVDNAGETAGHYKVRSIPTLIIMKDGEKTNQFVGVQDEQTLLDAVG